MAAAAPPPCAPAGPTGFDAAAAWTSFEEALRKDYAYFDRGGPETEAAIAKARARALASTDQQQLSDVLQAFSKIFADPHFVVRPHCEGDQALVPSASDLWGSWAGAKAMVIDVRAGSAADRAGIRPGWTIVTIDGKPAAEMAAAPFEDYLASLTPDQRDWGLNLALTGKLKQGRRIEFHDGTAARQIDLPTGWASVPATSAGSPPLTVRRDGSYAIVRFNNSLGNLQTIADFEAALASVADADRLILDFRDTPGGGTSTVARGIIGHFVTTERPYQVHVYPFEERRYGVVRKAVEHVLPRMPFFDKPVVAIGGRWTGSMGEGLMIGLEANGVRTIGSPLSDELGGGYERQLGSLDVHYWLANEALYHVDGRAREAYVPQRALISADRDAGGGDPGLAAALALIKTLPAPPSR